MSSITPIAIIFSGPTLSKGEGEKILNAIYLDPAGQGDIYNACKKYNPQIIGIIDGYFETIPSVWHKEILFAMAEGVHVLGSSSTGALRATELEKFGMIGVGKIYEAYHQGRLEDDDEVAVYHGPKDLGFPLLSEAMVNIRQTALDAVEQNIISFSFYEDLIKRAKLLHYKVRNYNNIFDALSKSGKWQSDLVRYKNWLPEGRRDLKKEDALTLLRRVREIKAKPFEKFKVNYYFEPTTAWIENIENFYRQE